MDPISRGQGEGLPVGEEKLMRWLAIYERALFRAVRDWLESCTQQRSAETPLPDDDAFLKWLGVKDPNTVSMYLRKQILRPGHEFVLVTDSKHHQKRRYLLDRVLERLRTCSVTGVLCAPSEEAQPSASLDGNTRRALATSSSAESPAQTERRPGPQAERPKGWTKRASPPKGAPAVRRLLDP